MHCFKKWSWYEFQEEAVQWYSVQWMGVERRSPGAAGESYALPRVTVFGDYGCLSNRETWIPKKRHCRQPQDCRISHLGKAYTQVSSFKF